MKRTYKTFKKAVIFLTGSLVIIVGIILLVVPGPGLLTIALGLLILSTEFEWAERHRENIKNKLQQAYEKSKNRHKKPPVGRKKED